MQEIKYLHHYTTIETLALILKNRTIRFNRLDRVDDLTEGNKYGDFHLSKFLFVSCWTDSEDESIPLWNMYAKNMTGVRISLPLDPFEYKQIKPHPVYKGIQIEGTLFSILPIEELITHEYFVSPLHISNKANFIRKIEYISDVELKKKRDEVVRYIQQDGKVLLGKIDGPQILAGYKSKRWDFQKEVRYIIMIYPSPPPSSGVFDKSWSDSLPDYLFKAIREGTGPDKAYFDIKIKQDCFDNIKVMLAPHATENDFLEASALLEKHTKNGSLEKSSFTGQIRV